MFGAMHLRDRYAARGWIGWNRFNHGSHGSHGFWWSLHGAKFDPKWWLDMLHGSDAWRKWIKPDLCLVKSPFIHLSIHFTIYPSIYLFIYPSIYPSIYLFLASIPNFDCHVIAVYRTPLPSSQFCSSVPRPALNVSLDTNAFSENSHGAFVPCGVSHALGMHFLVGDGCNVSNTQRLGADVVSSECTECRPRLVSLIMANGLQSGRHGKPRNATRYRLQFLQHRKFPLAPGGMRDSLILDDLLPPLWTFPDPVRLGQQSGDFKSIMLQPVVGNQGWPWNSKLMLQRAFCCHVCLWQGRSREGF